MSGEQPARETILDSRVKVPQHVVYRAFANETVVLNRLTGKYHGLNPTGGRMLEVLEGSAKVREAGEVLAAQYARPAVEIEGDLYDFCLELLEFGLIEMNGIGEL
jgi:hypothetical protein